MENQKIGVKVTIPKHPLNRGENQKIGVKIFSLRTKNEAETENRCNNQKIDVMEQLILRSRVLSERGHFYLYAKCKFYAEIDIGEKNRV